MFRRAVSFANLAGRWFDIQNSDNLWTNPEAYKKWQHGTNLMTLNSSHEVFPATWALIHGQTDNLREACEIMNRTDK